MTGPRIDCQSHLFCDEFLRLLEKRKVSPYVYRDGADRVLVVGKWRRRIPPHFSDVEFKLAAMDAAGIELAALSTNDPGPELFGDDSPAIATLLNDFIAETVRKYPDRFFGLATLPYNSPDAMLREFERAICKLGMKGILLYSNLNGRFPDEEPLRPLFAEAELRGVPLLLHPASPVTYEATKGYDMTGGLGLMFDTTIALCRIILAGILEQHPDLKLLCPHLGGALPFLIGHVQNERAVESLRQVYLDTVSPISLAIRYAYDFSGADRLLYASDHPWVDPALIKERVQDAVIPPADEAKIFSENARNLFGLV